MISTQGYDALIHLIVNELHVSTTDEVVRRIIRDRFSPHVPRYVVCLILRKAIRLHHRNQMIHRELMGK